MNKIKWIVSGLIFLLGSAFAQLALAHAVVSPKEASIGVFQSFNLGVPVEEDEPTVAVRLLIPDNLEFVTPTVKPGWQIQVKKQGEGDAAKVTEISWTNGSIPSGQRDDFTFSAKVPSEPGTIQWKVYQTYADGDVVAWDQAPGSEVESDDDNHSSGGPYSQTQIIDDLSATTSAATGSTKNTPDWSLVLSIIALALSVVAFSRSSRQQQ